MNADDDRDDKPAISDDEEAGAGVSGPPLGQKYEQPNEPLDLGHASQRVWLVKVSTLSLAEVRRRGAHCKIAMPRAGAQVLEREMEGRRDSERPLCRAGSCPRLRRVGLLSEPQHCKRLQC